MSRSPDPRAARTHLDEGEIRWPPGARVGYVPQRLDIERDLPLTGHDFLEAKARLAGASRDDVRRALDLVNVTPGIAAMPIGTLSGGQFQRLLLAFALLGEPSVLLFDEPTAGIDEPGEERLYEQIQWITRERRIALLLISHELSLVHHYASRVLCLGRGRSHISPPAEALTPENLQDVYGSPMKYHLHE